MKPIRSEADCTNAVQATLSVPPHPLVTMMRGIYLAYGVILLAYFPVAIAGYVGALPRLVYASLLLLLTARLCVFVALQPAAVAAAAGDKVPGASAMQALLLTAESDHS